MTDLRRALTWCLALNLVFPSGLSAGVEQKLPSIEVAGSLSDETSPSEPTELLIKLATGPAALTHSPASIFHTERLFPA